ncbi:hypothetical protein KBZ18_11300 [Synechococcus sp. Cruz-9H2]|uniref:hypothetical protein n=1 Tax=unclassified Synechococcus TaxID=2626047 RepID=UPI0020CF1A04|nr:MULTISPECIES: hypothetical protein [unclassified Synechococcus]MCP9820075.1 hypothetical protein [Synechococcus sp. Cruz-9H2]MCP9844381.1 hypothetical protein [Synechococcus sp. Edmonson 11F2]MCP9856505.1 hypothetical protein [Synechococcus sp. Cruz-9C9]MCP9863720.1 hypothetical protein [Synechococcus sp. Cruz-7E5]MCP9870985.1 hypothetical protein [Synechococcus sp. Cruz-7B9]
MHRSDRLAGLLIGVAEWHYQWLSEAGFWLQALWPLGGGAPRSPLLAALPLVGTALFMALAWGPLAAGRGRGITGILVLQDNQEQPLQERALASLSVGTEFPSAALGASILLAPLRKLPPALVAAIGEGAGLGAAFCSPARGGPAGRGRRHPLVGRPAPAGGACRPSSVPPWRGCGLFVFSLQNEPSLLALLLTGSAGGAALGRWLGGITWNESQLDTFRRG